MLTACGPGNVRLRPPPPLNSARMLARGGRIFGVQFHADYSSMAGRCKLSCKHTHTHTYRRSRRGRATRTVAPPEVSMLLRRKRCRWRLMLDDT